MRHRFLHFLRDIVKPAINIWYLWMNHESKHIIYLVTITLYVYAMSKFLPINRLQIDMIDPNEFELNKLNKYVRNSSKECLRRWSWLS